MITKAWLDLLYASGGGGGDIDLTASIYPQAVFAGILSNTPINAGAWGGEAYGYVSVGLNVFPVNIQVTYRVEQSVLIGGPYTTVHTFAALIGAGQEGQDTFTFTGPFLRMNASDTGGGGGNYDAFGALGPLVSGGGGFPALSVGLFTAVNDRGLDTSLADLSRPSGGLNTLRPVPAWSESAYLSTGLRTLSGPLLSWTPGADADAAVIAGWFLCLTDSPNTLMGWEWFPHPVICPLAASACKVQPLILADPFARWLAANVIP